ncbi:MAG: Crp/Fnr family transcriptional regulator [Rhizobiaceae bacterium]
MRSIELFSDFGEEQLRLLAFGSQKLAFPKGTNVFHDGQSTDGGYLIVSGLIELIYSAHGSERAIGRFGPGDLIGEMAILTRNKRVGSAIVVEDCELIKISRSTMHRILDEYPELAALLHQRISQSVAKFTDSLASVEQKLNAAGDS